VQHHLETFLAGASAGRADGQRIVGSERLRGQVLKDAGLKSEGSA
jgi:hypothetical protein